MNEHRSKLIEIDPVTHAEDIAAVSFADILNQRAQPVALFTPALLITHGGFDRDPVVEFNALCPAASADLKPFVVDLKKDHERFFVGLGGTALPGKKTVVDFDKRLYAIAASRAEECFEFLGGIAFSDPRTQFFAQTCSYTIDVPDPTSKRQQFLSVRVFGVVASNFVALLQPRLTQPPIAIKTSLTTTAEKSAFLRRAGIVGVFDGIDPLHQRD
jgi:hypothetical protein